MRNPALLKSGPLALGALGVVFGDIGTSPLYAFKQTFTEGAGFSATHAHVLGILSLIFWALVGVVCFKYVTFILRADYDGEGGTLALLAQIKPTSSVGIPSRLAPIALLVLFGSGMLYGDGVITPAISVLSAVEGINVATKAAQPFVVPITVGILAALFFVQKRGTGSIGAVFGPVMLVWFVAIGLAGAFAIGLYPHVLVAIDPRHAITFLFSHGYHSVLVLGAVVLCVSGVEALYADLGHFGRIPITWAWYGIVFPALLLNYFGQGALVLHDARTLDSPFYSLFPGWSLYPMIALSTAATIIASQALISGAFSLTQQAISLGYSPRLRVLHTSAEQAGQIYIPVLNALLMIACLALVVTFKTSDSLGAAYGLAVTVTMLATSITYFAVARERWRWPLWQAGGLVLIFLLYDLSFLVGNLPKLGRGGWIPAVIAMTVFTIFTTWVDGRRRLAMRLAELSTPVDEFIARREKTPPRGAGTAVFLTSHPEGIPFGVQHHWLHNDVLSERIVLMTFLYERQPYVDESNRVKIEALAPNLLRIKACYGFMQLSTVGDVIHHCDKLLGPETFKDPIYFLSRPTILRDPKPGRMWPWRRGLYAFLLRNSQPITSGLDVPPDRVVEFGVEIRV